MSVYILSCRNRKPEVVSKELSTKMGNLRKKVLLTNLVSLLPGKIMEFGRQKVKCEQMTGAS